MWRSRIFKNVSYLCDFVTWKCWTKQWKFNRLVLPRSRIRNNVTCWHWGKELVSAHSVFLHVLKKDGQTSCWVCVNLQAVCLSDCPSKPPTTPPPSHEVHLETERCRGPHQTLWNRLERDVKTTYEEYHWLLLRQATHCLILQNRRSKSISEAKTWHSKSR